VVMKKHLRTPTSEKVMIHYLEFKNTCILIYTVLIE
jgi:hypothetical protein